MRISSVAKILAKNLKRVRLAKHMTQAEVAKKAGITSTHYARIERGEATPSITTVAALVKSLKSNSSEILPF